MKSRWKIVALVLACFAVVALGLRHYFSNVRYIERITGIEIPRCDGGFQTYGYDFGVSGFGQISPNSLIGFRESNDFEPCDYDPKQSIYGVMFENIQLAAEEFPPIERLLTSTGNSEANSWCFYLDSVTRSLWVTVLHPDMSGDLPPGATGPQD